MATASLDSTLKSASAVVATAKLNTGMSSLSPSPQHSSTFEGAVKAKPPFGRSLAFGSGSLDPGIF